MTKKMRQAVALMRRARAEDSTTDDGVITSAATFYDTEIKVAYVNFHTAEALAKAGLIEFGDWDPDWHQITLSEVAA